MTFHEFQVRYGQLRDQSDYVGIAQLLADHPDYANVPDQAMWMMHTAARDGDTRLVVTLLDAGVDVNTPGSVNDPSRPINAAVLAKSAETVRVLLEHGSDVNWSWDDGPYLCEPLTYAVRFGRLDIVRMLVEAGALLNVADRKGSTPLSDALAYGYHEIAEYLRSKGAKEVHELPGYVKPVPLNPIVFHVTGVGAIHDDAVAQEEGVTIRLAMSNDCEYILFTVGMSDQAMNVPSGGEDYQYAELVLFHPDYPEPDDFTKPEYVWLSQWLLRISRYPFEKNTWLGGKWTIISNEEPPQPLSEHTEMTCWLLLGEKEPLDRAFLPDGKSVCFYTLMPIHTAERDLALRDGIVALLQRFADLDVPVYLDPNRESVV